MKTNMHVVKSPILKLSVVMLAIASLVACGQSESPSTVINTSDDQQQNNDEAKENSDVSPGFPTQVYFGDTHLHTSNSGDAFAYGARLSPDHAYRFAKGEEVTSSSGQKARLAQPLDFLVVADHAEGLGVLQALLEGNETLTADPQMARWSKMIAAGGKQSHKATQEIIRGLSNKSLPAVISDPADSAPFARSIWQSYVETADQHNSPGEFTALIGYEYTSAPQGNNLHRVVVFRDGAERAAQVLPFSSTVSEDPEDLWAALGEYELKTGGKALAIPHNPNLSNGKMFPWRDFNDQAIDAEYAASRSRWEPLVEATQIKGDSESHPFLSPNDEYASYGDSGWQQGNLTLQTAKTNDMLGGEYVREALKRGLRLQQDTGVNPYKFGMIGSTDSHTGLATADEDNFYGKNRQMEPKSERTTKVYKKAEAGAIYGWQYLAGGYAAVWAQDNTREALFDAMLRKEVYSTTGPRINLRFFGGYGLSQEMLTAPNLAELAYQKGVPMGGDLTSREGLVPGFLVRALQDPQGSRLAKLQIVKGWVDENGVLGEKVYDIASSEPTLGLAELSTYWQDPEFDPSIKSFYYVRVLEVPTNRWPAYDEGRYEVEIPEAAKAPVQERAYSSPIWYSPG